VTDHPSLEDALSESGLGRVRELRRTGGGDTTGGWRAETEQGRLFVKTADGASAALIESEAAGLAALKATDTVRVPRLLAQGRYADTAWMALEWLDLSPASAQSDAALGEALAALHRSTSERFGWDDDNFIGATPQPNTRDDDWCRFFAEQRLGYQLSLLPSSFDELRRAGEQLLDRLPGLFAEHRPIASLIHGDLWSGNHARVGEDPVIFDPAVHHSDREADIAMTRLFGGFDPSFYRAYDEAWPLEAGYETRLELYQLYHVLNHVNLFGSGYVGQAMSGVRRLLKVV